MNHGVATGIAILAIGAISVASVIIGVLRRETTGGIGRVPPPHPAASADEVYDLVLRGGAWVNGINVTWPSASLLVGRGQIELRAYAVEPIRIAHAEVTALCRARSAGA